MTACDYAVWVLTDRGERPIGYAFSVDDAESLARRQGYSVRSVRMLVDTDGPFWSVDSGGLAMEEQSE